MMVILFVLKKRYICRCIKTSLKDTQDGQWDWELEAEGSF